MKERKMNALSRLEAQLLSGVKTTKGQSGLKVELTQSDKKRIEKEIAILKEKISKL